MFRRLPGEAEGTTKKSVRIADIRAETEPRIF
jgi:hypothetical protein